MEEEVAALAVNRIKGLGPKSVRDVLKRAGSLAAIFEMDWSREEAVGEHLKRILAAKNLKAAREDGSRIFETHQKNGIKILPITSKLYPKRLLHCSDAPVLMFCKGKTDLNRRKVLSIVGTRKSTAYGRSFMEKLGQGLKDKDILVVSGLAYGIDTLAHKMSLKNELPTVGVMGTGFHIMYPAANRHLASQICKHGALLTEYPVGEEAVPGNFAMRNRIIAGMSDAVLVVETGPKGGAMITANLANSYNRDVLAVPGRVNDLYSAGCNNLIRNQQAHLVSSASDLLYILGWDDPPKPKVNQGVLALEMDQKERKLAELLQVEGEQGIDDMALSLSLPISELSALLLQMELKGYIREQPGKRYSLNM